MGLGLSPWACLVGVLTAFSCRWERGGYASIAVTPSIVLRLGRFLRRGLRCGQEPGAPVLGFSVPFAAGNMLLAIGGAVLVVLMT